MRCRFAAGAVAIAVLLGFFILQCHSPGVVEMGGDHPVISPSVSPSASLSGSPLQCTRFDPWCASLLNCNWWFSSIHAATSFETEREFRTEPLYCPLRRFTHVEAVKCLAGRHVAFVGDSLTGYQYQALVVWLETGAFPDPIGDRLPSNTWMRMTHDENGCGGHNRCEVYHDTHNMPKLMDNRYYFSPDLNITLTKLGFYARAFGHGPIGWFSDVRGFDQDWLWENGSLASLAPVLAALPVPVDELVMNVGVWGVPEFESRSGATSQLLPFDKLFRSKSSRPIWATPTLQRDRPELGKPRRDAELGHGYAAAQSFGWRILDRNGMIRALFSTLQDAGVTDRNAQWSDRTHFQPYVNVEFNNVLLNMLC